MSCSRRHLAAGDLMVVEQCACGAVHVTIGAVTLRLAESALPSLAATMNEAVHRLRDREEPTTRTDLLS